MLYQNASLNCIMMDLEANSPLKNYTAPPLKNDCLVLPPRESFRDEVTSGQPTTINGSANSTTEMGRFTISPLPIYNTGRVIDHLSIHSNETVIGYSPTSSNGVPIKYSTPAPSSIVLSSNSNNIDPYSPPAPSSITLSSNSNNIDPYSPPAPSLITLSSNSNNLDSYSPHVFTGSSTTLTLPPS